MSLFINKVTAVFNSDVFCGRLLCQDNNKTLHHYFKYFITGSYFIANDACHSVIFDFGLETQDPGLVPSGAKCGVDKARIRYILINSANHIVERICFIL